MHPPSLTKQTRIHPHAPDATHHDPFTHKSRPMPSSPANIAIPKTVCSQAEGTLASARSSASGDKRARQMSRANDESEESDDEGAASVARKRIMTEGDGDIIIPIAIPVGGEESEEGEAEG